MRGWIGSLAPRRRPPQPQSVLTFLGGLPGRDSLGWTCCKGNSYPADLGGGAEKVLFLFRGRGRRGLSLFIFWKREARASRLSSHPRERASPGAQAAPGVWLWSGWEQMAPDPQLRRPGNVRLLSGAGAGPGGRKEHLSSPAPSPIPPQAGGFSRPGSGARCPIVLPEGAGEKGMSGGIEKSKLPTLGCAEGSGPQCR